MVESEVRETGAGSSVRTVAIEVAGGSTTEDLVGENAGHSRFLDAFTVALNAACDEKRWYVSTMNLQLASLQFCTACRNVKTLHVRMDSNTAWRRWHSNGAERAAPGTDCSGAYTGVATRVPTLRPRGITWLPRKMPQAGDIELLAGIEFFTFGDQFHGEVAGVVLPQGLKEVTFGDRFNTTIKGVSWPASLIRLTFGSEFNQPIHTLPPSLEHLTFGYMFNRPLDCVVWPSSLLELTIGENFNQALDGVLLPESLQTLFLGRWCTQALDGVQWPASLQRLTLGDRFNSRIDNVAWPGALQHLSFGERFNQPLHNVVWPSSLQTIIFGYNFNRAIDEVTWPESLQQLTFGACFDMAIDKVVWPPSLEELHFGYDFNQPINGITWPASLVLLTLAEMFNEPLQGATALPASLEEFILKVDRGHYCHSLAGVEWPATLRKLVVSDVAGLDALQLPAGASLLVSGQRRPDDDFASNWLQNNSYVIGAS